MHVQRQAQEPLSHDARMGTHIELVKYVMYHPNGWWTS